MRQIGDGLHKLAEALVGFGCGGFEGIGAFLESGALETDGLDVFAFALEAAEFSGEGVALRRFEGFGLRDGVAAFAVDGREVAKDGGWVHAAAA